MSSREIAELTGKALPNVHRDIRNLLEALGDDSKLNHVEEIKDARGYVVSYLLQKREALILVSGYSPVLRARIIDRWQELEQAVAAPRFAVPQTLPEALRLAADEMERRGGLVGGANFVCVL